MALKHCVSTAFDIPRQLVSGFEGWRESGFPPGHFKPVAERFLLAARRLRCEEQPFPTHPLWQLAMLWSHHTLPPPLCRTSWR